MFGFNSKHVLHIINAACSLIGKLHNVMSRRIRELWRGYWSGLRKCLELNGSTILGFLHRLQCKLVIWYLIDKPHRWCNCPAASSTRSAVDRGFKLRSGQTKDYAIYICRLSAKHSALRSKNKDCDCLNQDNMSEWSDMSTYGLLNSRFLHQ
jgi:hypothetical protein